MTEHATEGPGSPPGDGDGGGDGDGDGRDPRLGLFGIGGELDGAPPSARALSVLDDLAEPSGPRGVPFAGSTRAEEAGLLAAAAAAESHAAWLKLTAVQQLIRRHGTGFPDGRSPQSPPPQQPPPQQPQSPPQQPQSSPPQQPVRLPGPDSWGEDLLHEVAVVLRIAWQSAYPVAELAWQLGARLRAVEDLLKTGTLTYFTAKIIADEFSVLDDEKVREAEKLLLDHDLAADDLTPGKLRRLCQRIADTVDPDGAARRREKKQRDQARVTFFRDHGGSAAMFASGLPPDEALMSDANVQKRALEYKAAGIREKTDLLRVLALTDLINGIDVAARLALWRAGPAGGGGPGGDAGNEGPGPGDPRRGDPGPGDPGSGPVPAGTPDPGLPSLINFTFPLATVLGQAARPGEAPGYGSVDPALVRALAAAAAGSPRSRFCLTFSDEHGHAAAHGCARLIRGTGRRGTGRRGKNAGPPGSSRDGPAGTGWSFTIDETRPGPEEGYCGCPTAGATASPCTPSRWARVTTATKPAATGPAPCCATSSKSVTENAPAPCAPTRRNSRTSSTRRRTTTAGGRAAATRDRAAAAVTGSSRCPAGPSSSRSRAGTAGRRRPAAPTRRGRKSIRCDPRCPLAAVTQIAA